VEVNADTSGMKWLVSIDVPDHPKESLPTRAFTDEASANAYARSESERIHNKLLNLTESRNRQSKLGDCYEVHGRFMLDNHLEADDYILVHAEVMGQGQLAGIPYGHCFLIHKATDTVRDMSNGRDINMPRAIYYLLGKIDMAQYWDDELGPVERIPKIYEYSRDEVMNWMSETGTFGPWELETESGY
jgi:hypothetical protein